FKGSGFYITDYRSENYKAGAKSDKPSPAKESKSSSTKKSKKATKKSS
ncbi:MAG: zinc ribbon domain-containing protein, partial [Limisphaerales bacterium]